LVGLEVAIAGKPAPTGIESGRQIVVGCQAAFASKLAPTEKQNSAAARGKAAPLNNER